MNRDKYLRLCEQLNKEPSDKEMPPDWDDFPEIVQIAVNIFNMLGDRVAADIGFMGKDYTNLNTYMELYNIEDKEFFHQILAWLDARAIKKSSDLMGKEREKLKRKSSGH